MLTGVEGFSGKWIAAAQEFAGTGGILVEGEMNVVELGFERSEDVDGFAGDIDADTVAGKESNVEGGHRLSRRTQSSEGSAGGGLDIFLPGP